MIKSDKFVYLMITNLSFIHIPHDFNMIIICTSICNWKKFQLISQFETRDELISVLAQSCFIPLYSGFRIPNEGSGWAVDGSYTDNLPLFEVCTFIMHYFID